MNADWLSAVSAATSSAALLTAGVFAYLRFVRGRVHHADLTIAVEPAVVLVAGEVALEVRVVMVNTGTLRLYVTDDCKQTLTVHAGKEVVWRHVEQSGNQYFPSLVATVDMKLEEQSSYGKFQFEPGERLDRSFLLALGPDDKAAYKVTMYAQAVANRALAKAKTSTWVSQAIMMRNKSADASDRSTLSDADEGPRPEIAAR